MRAYTREDPAEIGQSMQRLAGGFPRLKPRFGRKARLVHSVAYRGDDRPGKDPRWGHRTTAGSTLPRWAVAWTRRRSKLDPGDTKAPVGFRSGPVLLVADCPDHPPPGWLACYSATTRLSVQKPTLAPDSSDASRRGVSAATRRITRRSSASASPGAFSPWVFRRRDSGPSRRHGSATAPPHSRRGSAAPSQPCAG